LRWLVRDKGKSLAQISKAMGIGKGGAIVPEYFTGAEKTDREMFGKLTPEERAVYAQAQKDHAESVRRFVRAANAMRGELLGLAHAAR
jgi:hypothetical protein